MLLAQRNTSCFTWAYVGKVSLTATLYYLTSRLGDIFTFIHSATNEQFQAFWAPSGIAFAMIWLFGRSMWTGIFIASILRTPLFNLVIGNNVEWMNTVIVSVVVAAGRSIEPIAGHVLMNKFLKGDKSLFRLGNAIRFIAITLIISVIGSGMASSVVQFIRHDAFNMFLSRTIAWYINNIFGVLLFTPFIISIAELLQAQRPEIKKTIIQLVILLASVTILFLVKPILFSLSPVALKVLYLLIIPILLLLAYWCHVAVSSLALMTISIIAVYLTAQDIGPFVLDAAKDSAVLLKSFMVVASFSTILSAAASNERKLNIRHIEDHARELAASNAELIKVNEELEQARTKVEESDRLKSSFLANISHEIRTPMNAIVGFSELLNRDLPGHKRKEFTQFIRQRSNDLLTIINDILYISKIESGQIISTSSQSNIQELLDRLLKNITAEVNHLHNKSIEIKAINELKGAENLVIADFDHLYQILTNLLHNALKFTDSGMIEFGCKRQDNETLLFHVKDSGIGIDAEQQEIIFSRFQQGSHDTHQRYGGTGLGLAIVKGLLDIWDGKIWVESEKGMGSTFFFTMPYRPASTRNLS